MKTEQLILYRDFEEGDLLTDMGWQKTMRTIFTICRIRRGSYTTACIGC